MSEYQRTNELNSLLDYFTAPHNAKYVHETGSFILAGNEPPWHTTGIQVKAGDSYSLFARGRIFWTNHQSGQPATVQPNLYGDASFHLWARVAPGGKIVNLSEDSGSFVADVDGRLELGLYMGMWADDEGKLKHTRNYSRLRGDIAVVVVVWRMPAADALSAIKNPAMPTPLLVDAERSRLGRGYRPPSGWHYLTETGANEIFFSADSAYSPRISVDAHNAQGIIRYPLDVPLSPSLTLNWQWMLNEHPSVGPENRAQFHDYVSIGAEFDNGRDLTWIWCQHLDSDHHFHCPVKDWTSRETHYVVRTKQDDYGTWLKDSRHVYRDVQISQGKPPAKIVAIWLIAVSTFSHHRLRATFKDIYLADGKQWRIL